MGLGKSQLSRLCPQPRKKSAVMKNVARNSSSEMAADVSLSMMVEAERSSVETSSLEVPIFSPWNAI